MGIAMGQKLFCTVLLALAVALSVGLPPVAGAQPSPPYPAPPGREWGLFGPSAWVCGQAGDTWPAAKSECFQGSGGWYWYGLRQAG